MQLSALSAAACAVIKRAFPVVFFLFLAAVGSAPLFAQSGEAALKLPDLHSSMFINSSVSGPTLLMIGLGVSVLGFVFGIAMYTHLRNLPVHESMLEISELIYETCKTYLITQGKFLMILEIFIGAIIVLYFGVLTATPALHVAIILAFSLIGIAAATAWRGSASA